MALSAESDLIWFISPKFDSYFEHDNFRIWKRKKILFEAQILIVF